MGRIKDHAVFVLLFGAALFVFLWKLILMRGAFIDGDYFVQFYPWSQIYSEAIKGLELPFWTRAFHSGFPLMAEGQVGGFYPFNILMFFLLPFRAAYNYIVVLHFLLAGAFTYLYTRKLGACQWGASLAALLFCFGSAYAGCFYNTVTVKTLIWVPLVLFLFEKYFEERKSAYVLAAGAVLGVQMLAGFIQMAFYSAFFYAVYFVLGSVWSGKSGVKDAFAIVAGLAVSACIAFPQIALSWPLVKLSGRGDATLSFALWGSFPPLNLMAVAIPYWIFTGTRLYIGVLSLLFLIVAFTGIRADKGIRPLFVVFCLAFLMALGKYNPLYVLLVKAANLYGFRNPSKILFFSVFAASVLSGWGFTRFFSDKAPDRRPALRAYSALLGVILAVFFAAKAVLALFSQNIIKIGEWYVTNFVYGRDFHRYDLSSYLSKVRNFYDNWVQVSSITNPFMIFSIVLCILAAAVSLYYLKNGAARPPAVIKSIAVGVIFLDLYVFSFYGTGFRGNIKSFDFLKTECPAMLERLRADKSMFRILPFGLSSGKLPKWALPNANSMYGLDSAAAYTPLVLRAYKSRLEALECVDDSLGMMNPSKEAFGGYEEAVRLLNVKYIVSYVELTGSFPVKIMEESGVYLYEVAGALPRAFMAAGTGQLPVAGGVVVDVYRSGYVEMTSEKAEGGLLVLSESFFPGWEAYIDGEKAGIAPYRDILMSVSVPGGRHKVVFRYSPWSIYPGYKTAIPNMAGKK